MAIYVLGFAFNEAADRIILIHKNRPAGMAGKLNGIGGKVEDFDVDYKAAMRREFFEETGVMTAETDWEHFADINFEIEGAFVACFRLFSDVISECRTRETEKVEAFRLLHTRKSDRTRYLDLNSPGLVSHAGMLISAAMNRKLKLMDLTMI